MTSRAISYSPSRILGALGRRRRDGRRGLTYRRSLRDPIQESVLFESFFGRMIGDSPLDLCRELQQREHGLQLLWSVADDSMQPPAGTTGLRFGSPEWIHALATSRFLVNNSNNPWYFRKRPEQRYLQTWHGTPLKRLVLDLDSAAVTQSYRTAFTRDSASWDHLVSPNPYSSAILPRAFGYPGPLLETGYPRNDRLVTADAATRAEIRTRLGIAADEQLLLYAPTWRDTQRTATGRWAAVNLLPSDLVLPDGWRLGFRGHTNTHDNHTDATARGALDLTRHRDMAELLIAADALLTDYSSVMFDFTVTGKPVILLTPDIDDYRGARGFYFDLAESAPGPVLTAAEQVPAVLADLSNVHAAHAERYQAWQKRFNPWDDGGAAARVVDAVFADPGNSVA